MNEILAYSVITQKQGCYSSINTTQSSSTYEINWNTDLPEYPTDKQSGVLWDDILGYLAEYTFDVYDDTTFVGTITTDEKGRFSTDISPGTYNLDSPYYNTIELTEGYSDYNIIFRECVDKPNIYLYPESEMDIDVSISFPRGGNVIQSIPTYPDFWKNLKVEPDGTIENKYDYLFYESEQVIIPIPEKGWVVEKDNLTDFFTENMQKTGFNSSEIDDFIEWWIPILTESEHFAIYPLYNDDLDKYIKLHFSEQPDNLLRLTYIVKECDSELVLESPTIPKFANDGFVVREWGVLPKDKHNHNIAFK
jgi:hypothetical protein